MIQARKQLAEVFTPYVILEKHIGSTQVCGVNRSIWYDSGI